jgi:hypothetical protein
MSEVSTKGSQKGNKFGRRMLRTIRAIADVADNAGQTNFVSQDNFLPSICSLDWAIRRAATSAVGVRVLRQWGRFTAQV